MRTRRPSPEHQEAVSRRLAQLSAELAGSRPVLAPLPSPSSVPDEPVDDWWEDHTRVAAPRLPPPPPEPPPLPVPATDHDSVPLLPRPGRHAARRRLAPGRVLASLVPDTLRGGVAIGPAHLAVVAVLVALGLALTCWWVVRGDAEPASGQLLAPQAASGPAPSASPAALETPAADLAPTASDAASGGPQGTVTVDVAGKVRRPGIAVLDAGARVVDAVEAAGGARRGVDLSSLNLARVLVDGEQILVGGPAASGPVPVGAAPSEGGAPATLVNLNTATPAELELLPEVGPVTAQAIVTWRDEHGGFTTVEELLEVDGIGDATLATVAPHVTV